MRVRLLCLIKYSFEFLYKIPQPKAVTKTNHTKDNKYKININVLKQHNR